jgi:hypothetical protein
MVEYFGVLFEKIPLTGYSDCFAKLSLMTPMLLCNLNNLSNLRWRNKLGN